MTIKLKTDEYRKIFVKRKKLRNLKSNKIKLMNNLFKDFHFKKKYFSSAFKDYDR